MRRSRSLHSTTDYHAAISCGNRQQDTIPHVYRGEFKSSEHHPSNSWEAQDPLSAKYQPSVQTSIRINNHRLWGPTLPDPRQQGHLFDIRETEERVGEGMGEGGNRVCKPFSPIMCYVLPHHLCDSFFIFNNFYHSRSYLYTTSLSHSHTVNP